MMTAPRWNAIYVAIVVIMLTILGGLILTVPRGEDGIEWTSPMIEGGWMAWTFPVALFFFCIATVLILFTLLAIRFPETPRRGVLHIETTRGDRLFITLLGSAFINLGWIFFFGTPLTGGLILCLIYALAVFRWV
jgi:predicted small integral membrane protein